MGHNGKDVPLDPTGRHDDDEDALGKSHPKR